MSIYWSLEVVNREVYGEEDGFSEEKVWDNEIAKFQVGNTSALRQATQLGIELDEGCFPDCGEVEVAPIVAIDWLMSVDQQVRHLFPGKTVYCATADFVKNFGKCICKISWG